MVMDVHDLYTQYMEGSFNLVNDWLDIQELGAYFCKYCEYDDAFYDLIMWCTTQDCSFKYMGESLMMKVF
jgi:hypothetical protein